LLKSAQPIETKQWSWLRGVDLNHRPLGYEPNELPDCSTPHLDDNNRADKRQTVVRRKACEVFDRIFDRIQNQGKNRNANDAISGMTFGILTL
jgi:hypothetical protein